MARRGVGFVQIALTLLGFAVFMGFMFWYFANLLQAAGDYTADLAKFQALAKSRAWIAGAGLGLVFIAWVWAVFTSLRILRAARMRQVPPPVP
jgi:hypothetical protein